MTNLIVKQLRKELKALSNTEIQLGAQRYFKEPIQLYGIKTPVVREISRRYYAESVKGLPKMEVFNLCHQLWESGYMEEATIAIDWCQKQKRLYEQHDIDLFYHWLSHCVSNWAMCDGFSCNIMGHYLMKFPSETLRMKTWAQADNRWIQRAAAVSLIVPARSGLHLPLNFKIAEMLLHSTDDMVQKGYGWLLKTASDKHLEEVFHFVMEHEKDMPRTAFRYAIENMPDSYKKKAMHK